MTQLKLKTLDKLSNFIFSCLWVCECLVLVTRHKIFTIFSKIYLESRILSLSHQVSSSTNLKWTITTKYQPASPYSDYWPGAAKYQSVSLKRQISYRQTDLKGWSPQPTESFSRLFCVCLTFDCVSSETEFTQEKFTIRLQYSIISCAKFSYKYIYFNNPLHTTGWI